MKGGVDVQRQPKTRWKLLAAIGLVAGRLSCQLADRDWATNHNGVPANAIMVIAPYWYNGTWVFDDPAGRPEARALCCRCTRK